MTVATDRGDPRNGPPSGPSQTAPIAVGLICPADPLAGAGRRQAHGGLIKIRGGLVTGHATSTPDEPPSWVTQRTLWRLAMCVIGDHRQVADACDRCAEAWPCQCRTLAERALDEAGRRPRRRRARNDAYLEWLRRYAGRQDEG
jgi:hypothetical protein